LPFSAFDYLFIKRIINLNTVLAGKSPSFLGKYFKITPTLILPPQGGGENRNENIPSKRGRREKLMTERKMDSRRLGNDIEGNGSDIKGRGNIKKK